MPPQTLSRARRPLLHKVLDRHGYRCIVAGSYDEALQQFLEKAEVVEPASKHDAPEQQPLGQFAFEQLE